MCQAQPHSARSSSNDATFIMTDETTEHITSNNEDKDKIFLLHHLHSGHLTGTSNDTAQ